MSEAKTIPLVQKPNTVDSLAKDLAGLGLKAGATVIVHSSLSSLGWVSGGSVAIVQAILSTVTASGTVIMPTHSSGYSEPSLWQNPPVPEAWWPIVRESMPAFDPRLTPTTYMGAIPEVFRTFPGVTRSCHPSVSFAAWGKHAKEITENHQLEWSLSDSSPLGRIYNLDGLILLLGVGHDSNTSLHLAESRLKAMPVKTEGAPILFNGRREWVTYRDFAYDTDDFEKIGAAFEESNSVMNGKVGSSNARLFSQRRIVDFAFEWLKAHRN